MRSPKRGASEEWGILKKMEKENIITIQGKEYDLDKVFCNDYNIFLDFCEKYGDFDWRFWKWGSYWSSTRMRKPSTKTFQGNKALNYFGEKERLKEIAPRIKKFNQVVEKARIKKGGLNSSQG